MWYKTHSQTRNYFIAVTDWGSTLKKNFRNLSYLAHKDQEARKISVKCDMLLAKRLQKYCNQNTESMLENVAFDKYQL